MSDQLAYVDGSRGGKCTAATMLDAASVLEPIDSEVTGGQATPVGLTISRFYPEVPKNQSKSNVLWRTHISELTKERGNKAGVYLLKKAVHGARRSAGSSSRVLFMLREET
jgi:hypothetical protein